MASKKKPKQYKPAGSEKKLFVRIVVLIVAAATILGIVIIPLTTMAYDADTGEIVTVDSFETGKLSDSLNEAMDGIDFNNVGSVSISGGTLNADDYNAIKNIPNIVYLELAKCETENGIIPGHALENRNRLTYASLPANTKEIGESAFSGSQSLVKISMPDTVESIGGSAFYNCSKLETIAFPASIANIGENAFYGCTSITSVTVPEKVTEIKNDTFSKCGIKEIYIGPDVTAIGANAFADCSELADIYFYGHKAPQVSADSFRNVSAIVHYPDGAEGYDALKANNITVEDGFNDTYVAPVPPKTDEAYSDEAESTETSAQTEESVTETEQTETAAPVSAEAETGGVNIVLVIVLVVAALAAGAGIMFIITKVNTKKKPEIKDNSKETEKETDIK